jgi:chemotaxis protein MotB
MRKVGLWLATVAVLAMTGCGPTDADMQAKQRELDKANADLKAAKAVMDADQAKIRAEEDELQKLREQVKQAGLSLDKSQDEAQNLKRALAEYKQRADQLAVIEARFRELRTKLDKLNQFGVKVVPRNNRLVVQLPGDILFDSGRDDLKQQGKEVLSQVAEVIRNDKDLNNRFFLVAGHTDNVKYPAGGPFRDNWGLSLMRARQVTLFLVDDHKADPRKKNDVAGGGLNPRRWSAAGYAEFDPIAGTVEQQSKDDQQKNRRVELVVQPNVEEMLNLGNMKSQ